MTYNFILQALEGKDIKDLLTNVGSAGPAAPAAAGGAAGGAAAPEAAPEEKKEEGKSTPGDFLAQTRSLTPAQRRRSPTRTWASVCSTKRFNRPEFEVVSFLLFPSSLIPHPPDGSLDDSLLYSILHDPSYEDLDHGEEKKENCKRFKRTRTFNGDWVLGLPSGHEMTLGGSIGCRCDSGTIVASRIIGELKKDVWHTILVMTVTV